MPRVFCLCSESTSETCFDIVDTLRRTDRSPVVVDLKGAHTLCLRCVPMRFAGLPFVLRWKHGRGIEGAARSEAKIGFETRTNAQTYRTQHTKQRPNATVCVVRATYGEPVAEIVKRFEHFVGIGRTLFLLRFFVCLRSVVTCRHVFCLFSVFACSDAIFLSFFETTKVLGINSKVTGAKAILNAYENTAQLQFIFCFCEKVIRSISNEDDGNSNSRRLRC